jgi:3-oxoacyl-[acyl-carrier-protein] synthase I
LQQRVKTAAARIEAVAVSAQTLVCATGAGCAALSKALFDERSALSPGDAPALWRGRVGGVDSMPWPAELAAWDSRATRLALAGLQADGFDAAVAAAVSRHGAVRIGLALGTSASTIAVSEAAYRAGRFEAPRAHEALNTLHAVTHFVQQRLRLLGPALTVSTACSSSAKVFAVAERWLRLRLVDAVVVAGVDALSNSLVYGFHALGLLGDAPCRPFAAERAGISLGEAAGFALLQRAGDAPPDAPRLRGWGEANDAHHMSSPHPEGLGAERALTDALARASVEAREIDYVNLHGTASARNDEVEAALVARHFAAPTCASATKGVTGHTMGAAGIVESMICLHALQHGHCPGTANTPAADAALPPAFHDVFTARAASKHVRLAANFSFGFGGNNSVLIFERGAR